MIPIGDKCHPYLELCILHKWDQWHDDHITFCQNHNFWGNITVRKNRRGAEFPHCTGNLLGFVSTHRPACLREAPNRCPDFSDSRKCPASACERKPEFFPCRDGNFCIKTTLVCDGYLHCEDGSDEDNCNFCPPMNGVGHPPRSVADRWANYFRCKHRYTKRDICAIKCDGRDDLCEDYADERDCERLPLGLRVLGAILVITAITIIFWWLDVNHPSWFKLHSTDEHPTLSGDALQLEVWASPSSFKQCVMDTRKKQFRAPILHNSIFRSKFLDPADGQQVCLFYFEQEVRLHSHPMVGEPDILHEIAVNDTNKHFFDELGTTDVAMILFDSIDNGLMLRLRKYLAREKPQLWRSVKLMQENMHLPLLIAFIFGHYLDIFKDVFLASDFSRFLQGHSAVEPYSLAVFLLMVFSIVLGLLANIVIVATFERLSRRQKLFGCIFIILVPAAVQYRISRLKSRLFQDAKTCIDEEELSEARKDLSSMMDLMARFRANENILEHFLQLDVLLILILIRDSKTTTAPPHLAQYVVETSGFFLFASSAWSFISLIRGQLSLTISRKNGFVPFIGKIVLLTYFTIGTGARVWALLLYFTPSLGLFNSLHYPTFAQIWAKPHELAVYNMSADGTTTWFHGKWNDHTKGKADDFYFIPSYILMSALLFLTIAHLCISWTIQRKVYQGAKLRVTEAFFDALYTMICPPVYLDWEGIYRQGGGKMQKSECWKKSANTMLAFQGLLLLEHLLMLIPLANLKVTIHMRNDFLGSEFPLVLEEQQSTLVVNWLLYTGLAGFVIQSISSLILVHVYVKKGHAWSKILNVDD